MLWGGTFAD
jgi:hypothetical protein